MTAIKILSEIQLRDLVPLDLDLIGCIEDAFVALAAGQVEMPPIQSFEVEEANGEVDVKSAHIAGAESFTIKMSPGFYDNPKLGLPTTNGIMVVFSARTGQVEAVLLDNGYLTEARTAAAGAVVARHLSRVDASKACVIGAGAQARLQIMAISQVRPLEFVSVVARDAAKGAKAAQDIEVAIGVQTHVATSAEDAVSGADIIVTTTPSRSPVLRADWLRKGQLVIAMGSDQDGKCELDPKAIANADHYVADSLSQTRVLGELRAAIAAGLVGEESSFPELGQIVSGDYTIDDPSQNLIICDLTGTGVQDTAIATLARQRADALGIGMSVTT